MTYHYKPLLTIIDHYKPSSIIMLQYEFSFTDIPNMRNPCTMAPVMAPAGRVAQIAGDVGDVLLQLTRSHEMQQGHGGKGHRISTAPWDLDR